MKVEAEEEICITDVTPLYIPDMTITRDEAFKVNYDGGWAFYREGSAVMVCDRSFKKLLYLHLSCHCSVQICD